VSVGVYCIKNKVNGKVYVGSSVNIRRRKTQHFVNLKRGIHPMEAIISNALSLSYAPEEHYLRESWHGYE
jgi:excinuclease UvrABC nuclease subunit